MLSVDVRFEGFTSTDWTRFLSIFRPRRAGSEERAPDRVRGGVVAVHAHGSLRKLIHSEVGRLRLDDAQRDWPLPASELARRHDASWAASVEQGTLDSILDDFGARVRRGDDVVAQLLTLLELARDELAAGRIDLWPHRLSGMPIPSAGMVHASLDAICPVGRTLALGLFDDGELWTSVALRRGPAGFDWIFGPDDVRAEMGLLAGDWRRDYRHLARAIEDRAGPLAFGCFAEISEFRKLEVDPTPGAWARAVALRDVILAPLPVTMAIPLGVDAGWAAYSAIRGVAERLDPLGVVSPALHALRVATIGDRDVKSVLGFHPLELLRKLLAREE